MNWSRFLLQVWLVGSLLWIGYYVWDWFVLCEIAETTPGHCLMPTPWRGLAIVVAGLPLSTLVGGLLMIWVARRLRRV